MSRSVEKAQKKVEEKNFEIRKRLLEFDEVMNEGFSLEEIGEIVAVIDMATMFNVYTSALRLDLDPQYRAVL